MFGTSLQIPWAETLFKHDEPKLREALAKAEALVETGQVAYATEWRDAIKAVLAVCGKSPAPTMERGAVWGYGRAR